MGISDLYAIVDGGEVLEFGLTQEQTQHRVGIKKKLVKYKRTVPQKFIKEIEICSEIPPVPDDDGTWYQQWSIEKLSIAEAKNNIIEYYKKSTYDEIISNYPEVKQRSDMVDIEYSKLELMIENNKYTSDIIKKTALNKSIEFDNGKTTLDSLVDEFPETERENWKQIIKAYIRVSWLISCKSLYNKKIQNIKKIDDYNKLKSNFIDIDYPSFPFENDLQTYLKKIPKLKQIGIF